MNIYVGNLAFQTTEETLRPKFEAFGDVASVNIIADKYTGRSRGFAFVEMPSDDQANAAIEGLDGTELDGRTLKVNKARPKRSQGGRQKRNR